VGDTQGPDVAHDHPHEHFGPADAARLSTAQGARATWVSIGGLGTTAAVQLVIVTVSGSVALLADTIHNITDALTAVPLLIAFRLARRPPDRRYSYGYHRAEDLAGVVIVALIAASAVLAGVQGVRRLVEPRVVDHVGWVLAAGIVGFAGNEAVAAYRIRVGRRIGSAALIADGYHARTDGLTSLGVVVAAIGTLANLERVDAVIGLLIALVIVWTLAQAGRSVLRRILDGIDEPTIALIEEVSASVHGVEHVSGARARWTGHRLRAEINVDVDATISVERGHDIAERVRAALLHGVPRLADVTVHVDPHEHTSHRSSPRTPNHP
jgi:cation diffusion facilitator family transporter